MPKAAPQFGPGRTAYHPVEPEAKVADNRAVPGGAGLVRLPPMQSTEESLPRPAIEPERTGYLYPNTGLVPLQISPSISSLLGPDASGTVQWVNPASLVARFEALRKEAATRAWASQAEQLVAQLGEAVGSQGQRAGKSSQAAAVCQRLEAITAEALLLARQLSSKPLAASLLRTNHALQRRLDVWEQLFAANRPLAADPPQSSIEQLDAVLSKVEKAVGGSPNGQSWRDFLLIGDLRGWIDEHGKTDQRLPAGLADRALERLTLTPMTIAQRQFVSTQPLLALRSELRQWAGRTAETSRLLAYLERYETTRLADDAKRLAEYRLDLDLAPDNDHRAMAERVAEHYRNANVRVAVSEALLDRLMPKQEAEYGRVRETVLGLPVRGNRRVSTDLDVRLIPDPSRVRLALEVTGEVNALTSSTAGPATFVNDSFSMYSATKPLEIDLKGIHLSPAEIAVYNRTRLRRVKTEYDDVPLVGSLVKGVARSRHEQNRDAADREIRRKIAAQAQQRVDAEVETRMSDLSARLQKRVVAPMETLLLEPTMIRAETAEKQFFMRLRLASQDQLGGTTPRPREPSDSLASFQIHETAINNAIEHLALDGKTFSVLELTRHIADRLHLDEPWETSASHDDVSITFAPHNAATVRCEDGQVVLTLSIAKLRNPPRSWNNFQVQTFYKPTVQGRSAELVRDGILHLIGDMPVGAQIPIRGVFARIFSKKQPVALTPQRLINDPAMTDLAITQFTVADGWIGIALGPKRVEQTAWEPRLLRR
jgi:hypothetical protein